MSTVPDRSRTRGWWPIVIGLLLWVAVIAWWWQRTSLWILDMVVVPLAIIVAGLGLTLVVIGLLRGRHSRGRQILLAGVLIPLMLVSLAVAGPYATRYPHLWMAIHKPMYTAALAHDPGSDYYGSALPTYLRVLAVDGKVSAREGMRFFPQWIGIPDDAGGFLYSPQGAPRGLDMYGRLCREPEDLGDGWWWC